MNRTYPHRLKPVLKSAQTVKERNFKLGRVTLDGKAVTVDVGLLTEAAALCSDEVIHFELTDEHLVMRNGITSYRFRIVDSDRANALTAVDLLADEVTADPLDWRKADDKRVTDALSFVSVGASTEASRPILTQIALTPDGTLASADGYRLHIARCSDARPYSVPLQRLRIAEAALNVTQAQNDLSACIVPPLAFEALQHKDTLDLIAWLDNAFVTQLSLEREVRTATKATFSAAQSELEAFTAKLIEHVTAVAGDFYTAPLRVYDGHSAYNATHAVSKNAAELYRAQLPDSLRDLSQTNILQLLNTLTLFAPDSVEARWIAQQQAIAYGADIDAQPVSDIDRRPKAWYYERMVRSSLTRVNLANQYIDAVNALIELQTATVYDETAYLMTKKALGKKERSPLVTGRFPDFMPLLPQGAPAVSLNVDCDKLTQALKIVGNYAKDNANSIRLTVDGNTLTLTGRSAERGESVQTLDIATSGQSEQSFEMATNYIYLLDACKTVPKPKDKRVSLDLYASDKPFTWSFVYDAYTVWTAMIMPMSSR